MSIFTLTPGGLFCTWQPEGLFKNTSYIIAHASASTYHLFPSHSQENPLSLVCLTKHCHVQGLPLTYIWDISPSPTSYSSHIGLVVCHTHLASLFRITSLLVDNHLFLKIIHCPEMQKIREPNLLYFTCENYNVVL